MDTEVLTYIGSCTFIIIIGLLITIWHRKQFIYNYQEKSVFITGTDTGFGRALALLLDKKGIKVYAGCYTEDGLLCLKEKTSDKMKCIKMDVTDENSLLAAKQLVEEDLATDNQCLWALVNNAGISSGLLFHMVNIKDYKACMNVNFFGVIHTTEIFLPLIKKSKGRIVNVISIIRRFPSMVEPYACSKVALSAYSDGLRRYMKDYGIHVAGIEPGFYPTEMTDPSNVVMDLDRCWKKLPENLKTEYGDDFLEIAKKDMVYNAENKPLSRFNHIDTVCEAILNALFSKNPKSSYICGVDAHLLYRFGLYVPDFMVDIIIRFRYSNIVRAIQLKFKNT